MTLLHTLLANLATTLFLGGPAAPAELPTVTITAPADASPGAAVALEHRAARVAQANVKLKAKKKGKKKKKAKLAKKRAKVRERIRALRAWRLTEALDLDEKGAAKLFPILRRFDPQFEKATQTSNRLRVQARDEIAKATPDQKKLDGIVEQMLKQQRQLWDLQEARFRAVRKVLSPQQAAKLLIVLPEIDRQLRRQIRRAMRGKGGALEDPFGGSRQAPRRSGGQPVDPFQ